MPELLQSGVELEEGFAAYPAVLGASGVVIPLLINGDYALSFLQGIQELEGELSSRLDVALVIDISLVLPEPLPAKLQLAAQDLLQVRVGDAEAVVDTDVPVEASCRVDQLRLLLKAHFHRQDDI